MVRRRYRFQFTVQRVCLAIGMAVPFLLICCAAMAHAWNAWAVHREVKQWPSVMGKLESVEFKESKDPIVQYTYEVEGQQYRGSTFSLTRCSTGPGWGRSRAAELRQKAEQVGAVPVYYDPHAPGRSCLYFDTEPVWTTMVVLIFILIVTLTLSGSCLLESADQDRRA